MSRAALVIPFLICSVVLGSCSSGSEADSKSSTQSSVVTEPAAPAAADARVLSASRQIDNPEHPATLAVTYEVRDCSPTQTGTTEFQVDIDGCVKATVKVSRAPFGWSWSESGQMYPANLAIVYRSKMEGGNGFCVEAVKTCEKSLGQTPQYSDTIVPEGATIDLGLESQVDLPTSESSMKGATVVAYDPDARKISGKAALDPGDQPLDDDVLAQTLFRS